MTAEIRTAAQREAERRTIDPNVDDPLPGDYRTLGWREGFAWGAVWAQARVTPTREQVERALIGRDFITGADAILALMEKLAAGE